MSISVQFGRSPGNQVVLDGHGNTCNFISFTIQAFRGTALVAAAVQNPLRRQETGTFRGYALRMKLLMLQFLK